MSNSLREAIDIIVPTWNNFEQLTEMVSSIARYRLIYPIHFIIINNGEPEISNQPFFDSDCITVLTPKKNLGWEGGLKLGLENSTSEFVMFANDDIYLPECSKLWLNKLLQPFHDKTVGAVGPITNVAMGMQNIFARRQAHNPDSYYAAPYLIGYCVLLRRSALDAVGGVDDTLPGGDDLDLSIRLWDGGYKTVIAANTFVWHHGFSTGTRVYGDHTKPGGWNSQEMTEKTNMALIRKHGLRRWYNCLHSTLQTAPDMGDMEGDLVREAITGKKVVEIGCGGTKTVPGAVGVDVIPQGEPIPSLGHQTTSVADIVADVSGKLPFKDGEFDSLVARHILEHCQDTVETLKEWGRVVRSGGRMIIVVPNQDEGSTIPMNPEHLHAFTPSSLASIAEVLGFKLVDQKVNYNYVSFITVLEKL